MHFLLASNLQFSIFYKSHYIACIRLLGVLYQWLYFYVNSMEAEIRM